MSRRWGKVLKIMIWTVIAVSVLIAVTCAAVALVGPDKIVGDIDGVRPDPDEPLAYPDPTQPWDPGTMELPPQQ